MNALLDANHATACLLRKVFFLTLNEYNMHAVCSKEIKDYSGARSGYGHVDVNK